MNLNTAVGNTLPQGLPEDEAVSLRACLGLAAIRFLVRGRPPVKR